MVFAVLRGVIAVVATEAAGIVHVADVVGMRSPGDFHEGKHILVVERDQFLACLVDQREFCASTMGFCER